MLGLAAEARRAKAGGGGEEWALFPGGFSKINEILKIARDFAQTGKWPHPLSSLSILSNI